MVLCNFNLKSKIIRFFQENHTTIQIYNGTAQPNPNIDIMSKKIRYIFIYQICSARQNVVLDWSQSFYVSVFIVFFFIYLCLANISSNQNCNFLKLLFFQESGFKIYAYNYAKFKKICSFYE